MRHPRIRIIQTACRRCGAPVATASRSVWGLDALKAKLERICEACMTPEEQDAMLREMGQQIAGGIH
jgi:hypothetical protein